MRVNATGWVDFSLGLYRKAHYYRDGVAACDGRNLSGENRSANAAKPLPPATACGRCLVIFASQIDDEAATS